MLSKLIGRKRNPYRHPLDNVNEVSRGVIRREQGKRTAAARHKPLDGAVERLFRPVETDAHQGRLPRPHVLEFRLA